MSNYEFKSFYKKHLTNYIEFRLSNGYSSKSFYYLTLFDKFLIDNMYTKDIIDKEIIEKYYSSSATDSKNNKIEKISRIIPFLKYLNTIGIEAYIPPVVGRKHKSIPYVLTYEEVRILFETIDLYFLNSKDNHYNYEYPIFFRLLYTTGMRQGEACELKLENINVKNRTIIVKEAKNLKDRIVYMSISFTELLSKYILKLKESYDGEWLFPTRNGKNHINKTTVDNKFREIVMNSSLGTAEHHPVPHSLRHTYVVHRVDKWISENNNLDDLMPYLSKQLGHSGIEETYYYYHTISSSFKTINDKTTNIYPEVDYEKE